MFTNNDWRGVGGGYFAEEDIIKQPVGWGGYLAEADISKQPVEGWGRSEYLYDADVFKQAVEEGGGGVNHLAEIDIREGKGKIGLDLEKQIFESKIC